MSKWLLSTAFLLTSFGCASGAANQSANSATHGTHDSKESLALETRRKQRKMRDLEHQVAKLENKLRARQRAQTSESASVPRLPVQVLEPDAQVASGAEQYDGEYELVGFDEEGVEIVYVGDAAQDRSVRPDTSDLRGSSSLGPPRSERRERPRRSEPSSWRETANDRLAVTDSVGPTVARQLANARPGTTQARRSTPSRPRPVPLPPPPTVEAQVTPAPKKRPSASKDRVRAQYNRYYQALRAGNHAFAVTGFKNFIERYPRHEFADNAQYWLAEAHYDQRDYQTALNAFIEVRRRYPTGNKVPAALLKGAYCHIALGDIEDGRRLLLELIQKYPNSKPAKLAAQRLETLEGN